MAFGLRMSLAKTLWGEARVVKLNLGLNLKKFNLFLFNHLLSWVFFFGLRRFLLRSLGFRVGSFVTVHWGVIFFDFSKCEIGDNVTINYGCYIDNRAGVYIGNNVNISHNVRIYSLGHNINSSLFEVVGKSVRIGNNVWIFPNVLVMPGVHLADNVVVLPGSVVTHSFDEGSVIGGNPARLLKRREAVASYRIDFPIWFAI